MRLSHSSTDIAERFCDAFDNFPTVDDDQFVVMHSSPVKAGLRAILTRLRSVFGNSELVGINFKAHCLGLFTERRQLLAEKGVGIGLECGAGAVQRGEWDDCH